MRSTRRPCAHPHVPQRRTPRRARRRSDFARRPRGERIRWTACHVRASTMAGCARVVHDLAEVQFAEHDPRAEERLNAVEAPLDAVLAQELAHLHNGRAVRPQAECLRDRARVLVGLEPAIFPPAVAGRNVRYRAERRARRLAASPPASSRPSFGERTRRPPRGASPRATWTRSRSRPPPRRPPGFRRQPPRRAPTTSA